ncbi:IQ and AAA domain-containing protein 1-like [Malaclemys terrapin pileata]|uniref:IQ and AAA domain-containing protein 1-like n=1 Tax=Malaclemys terrapin pileata TaxID=2991368 RepID=UPI0023A80181|nr:IQ and AAA domain-containing protein 1-like [Malaclemys terrapin pileata]
MSSCPLALRRCPALSSTYTRMWLESQAALKELLAQELPSQPPRPETDQRLFFHMLATLFLRYTQILRCLETCYDQMVHPQKRRVLQHMLDGVMGRVLELKNEMVETELSEYHYMDDVLQDLKLTPADMEVPIPKYFVNQRAKALKERQQVLSEILARVEPSMPSGPSRPAMLRDEAVQLVQMAERMRQGRLRSKFMWEIRRDEERERRARETGAKELDREQAAICIQKVWKGCLQRRCTKLERQREMAFIGMAPDPKASGLSAAMLRAQLGEEFRRLRQADYEAEYQQALVSIREGLYEVEGPDMREEMKEQLRQWFIECHDLTGHFPEFPDEEIGGSSILFAEKTPEQVKAELDLLEAEGQKKKDKKKDKEKTKEGKQKKGKGKKQEEDEGLKLAVSKFLPVISEGFTQYQTIWGNRGESDNFEQRYEPELIKAQKRKEVEKELRLQVDELMREELQRLKLAVDRDDGKSRRAKKSGKKQKGKKGGKKEKDLTPDRTLDSLYEELVLQGILKQAQHVQLADYTGDFCYLGTTLRMAGIEPTPSVMDIRQNIALYAILRLGSPTLHEMAPLVKSVLLAGPAGTGKKMLVHAVCTETGANLFDLSPDNLVGKYPGKAGLSMLMHVVFKVARLMQPSVIWIGNAEKTFYKKVPKEEKQADPKRLKRDLPKALKLLKPEDRVLLIGTSDKPYAADVKTLCKAYERILLLPRPDYASRYVTWQRLIKKHGGTITTALDVSALAKLSDGYSQGHMARAVQMALTERRLLQMPKKPLRAGEFLQLLAKADPMYSEEEKTLQDWYVKTPLGKKRLKAAQESADRKEGKGKDKKGKKGKK